MSDIALIQIYTVVAVASIISVSAVAAAFGMAYLGGKFLDNVARQPEMASMLTTRFFMSAGLLDGVPMMGVGVALWFAVANPFLAALTGMAG